MAIRPVFLAKTADKTHIQEIQTNFIWFPGFSKSQKQKSIESLHNSFMQNFPQYKNKILEISSKSKDILGVNLSAFNLYFTFNGQEFNVESAFQASKVFEFGGPYIDVINKEPKIAKSDERLKSSGSLRYFIFQGIEWELTPKTAFYDWLYINAVIQNKNLYTQILDYKAFTDIEFNHKKSINCQAKSAALLVSLYEKGISDNILKNKNSFIKLYK